MNIISEEKWERAVELFADGASIREVMRAVGIAKETAHRIQQFMFVAMIEGGEAVVSVKVNKWAKREIRAEDIPLGWVKRANREEMTREEWVDYLHA